MVPAPWVLKRRGSRRLDDACALPSNWRETWDHPRQWGLTGEKNWATKYGAQGSFSVWPREGVHIPSEVSAPACVLPEE